MVTASGTSLVDFDLPPGCLGQDGDEVLGSHEGVRVDEAAEFNTMTPHAFEAVDGTAELITIFDRDGQRAHVHHESAR